MAALEQESNARVHTLRSECTIGRDPASSLCITDPKVSAQHASVRWDGTAWVLRDLGSRNGTFLDGKRLPVGVSVALQAGARLAFGDERAIFRVVDTRPPQASARTPDGRQVEGEDDILILPDADAPELTIFATAMGTWLAEYNDGTRHPVLPGMEFDLGGHVWRVDVPAVLAPTVGTEEALFSLRSSLLRFHVSLNEETVSCELMHRGQTLPLVARAHLYLLLILARARLEDRDDPHLPESEHGWRDIEELMDQLKIDENRFNVSIYRARQQFAKAGVHGATDLVERRKGERKLRIGVARIEIVS